MTPLEKLLALKGLTSFDLSPKSKVGRIFRSKGVRKTSTIDRVLKIDRRTVTPEAAAEMVELLSEAYGLEPNVPPEFCAANGCDNRRQTLRPLQAVAICEGHDWGGLFAPLSVGLGKTLISLLLSVAYEAKRPMLLVPAKLRDKTFYEIRHIAAHWKVPRLLRAENLLKHPGDGSIAVLSYEMLGIERYAELLETLKPDWIIADECHKLRNPKAAVTRRVKRYATTTAVRPHFAFLSGSIAARSILDFAHLLEWSLPDLNPTPEQYPERVEWALCLDTKVDAGLRLAPGALEALWNDEERKMLDAVAATRSGFRRRLVETPGVVATSENELGVSLRIETLDPWAADPALDTIFRKLRAIWELPDGQPIPDPPSFWRHSLELSLGFWYRWKVQPPMEWLEARRGWCTFVRETLKHNQRKLDSEGQIASACERGEYDPEVWLAWKSIRGTFIPETEAVWVSERVVDVCAKYLKDAEAPIVWVSHVLFGEVLAARTGLPYYGAGGKDARSKRSVVEAEPGRPMIASVASNSEGRNLQAWRNNLITHAVPRGALWEQMLGRTHRPGQEADEVTALLLTGCSEALAGFEQARADARFIEQTTGSKQKLCYADVVHGPVGTGPRWA